MMNKRCIGATSLMGDTEKYHKKRVHIKQMMKDSQIK
jgi:hypothetical protein